MKTYLQVMREIARKEKIYWEKQQEILDMKLIEKDREKLTREDISKINFANNLNAQIQILKWVTD